MKLHETNSYSELHSKFPRHSYRQVIRIRIKCKFDKFVSRNSSRRKGRNELKIIQIRMTNSLKKFREKKSRRIFRIHATREYTWLVFPSDTIPKPILTCITKWHWSLTPHRDRWCTKEKRWNKSAFHGVGFLHASEFAFSFRGASHGSLE